MSMIPLFTVPSGMVLGYPNLDPGMERYDSVLIGEDRLVGALEELAFSLVSRTLLGQVVNTGTIS